MIYFIQNADTGHVKIGRARNVQQRLSNLQTANSGTLVLLARCAGSRETERDLHQRFKSKHVRGEWFDISAQDVEEVAALLGGPVSECATKRLLDQLRLVDAAPPGRDWRTGGGPASAKPDGRALRATGLKVRQDTAYKELASFSKAHRHWIHARKSAEGYKDFRNEVNAKIDELNSTYCLLPPYNLPYLD